MKRFIISLILILVLLLSSQASGTTYYVDKTTGNDADSGLTEELAWETLAKVSAFAQATEFGPDDQILLKRGETWAERLELYGTGTSGHNVVYGAYGTGADPIIRDIYHRNAYHANVTGNNEYITVQDMQISYDAGRGIDAQTINHIVLQRLYIFSCASAGIDFNTEGDPLDDWVLTDIEIYNCGARGIWSSADYNNMVATNLKIHGNTTDGASFRYGTGNSCTNCVAYNNTQDGFDIGGTAGSFTFNRCKSYNNASAGFSIKGVGTGNILDSVSYWNNEGIDIGATTNSTLYNNTICNNDFIGIYISNTGTHAVKNNIIYGNGEATAPYGFQVSWLAAGQTLTADYNFYGVQSAARTIYVAGDAAFKTFAEWQAYDGNAYDQHGGSGDPLLVDATAGTELVVNGTMEADANWTASGFDNGETNERSAVQKLKGSYSRHAVVNDPDEGFYSDAYSEVEGQLCRVVFRYYRVSGEMECRSTQTGFDTESLPTTGSWVKYAFTYTATATRVNQRVSFMSTGGAGAEFYIDEVSIKTAPGNDFTLKPGSSCRDSGDTTIDTTRIKWGSTWPDGVLTVEDKSIGAYGSPRGAAGM